MNTSTTHDAGRDPGDLIAQLEDAAARIRQAESVADGLRHDFAAYRDALLAKIDILAGLPEQADEALSQLPEEVETDAAAKLEDLARRALQARDLDSIFYMSALLYPDDHVPGRPNELEAYIDRLKDRIA
jgi:hypothetical protein